MTDLPSDHSSSVPDFAQPRQLETQLESYCYLAAAHWNLRVRGQRG